MHSFLQNTLLIVLMLGGLSLGQAQTSDAWQNVHSAEGVAIDYQLVECDGISWLALRVHNSNSWPVNISYDISTPNEIGNDFFVAGGQVLSLAAAQTLSGSCIERAHPQLLLPLLSPFEKPQSIKLSVSVL